MTYTDHNQGVEAMVEMSDIIDKLAEGTQQNRVPWKTAASDKSFIAVFRNQSVLLSTESVGVHDKTTLYVLDERGNKIDHATHDSMFTENRYEQLWQLYQAVKQYCKVKTDRRLAELIAEIEAAPPIAPS